MFTSFPFSCLQIVLKYVIAPSPRRLHFRFASTAVAEDCQKFQKTYHETQDTCKCLTQPLLTVTFPIQAHSQCPSHLQTLRFILASLGVFFLRQKLCLIFITGKLITSKAFHHTQRNLKWPSFAKQIFAKQMLKRSIVPNLETTTNYGFPPNCWEEPARGKPKKSRTH